MADEGISNFWITGQSLMKENCQNSRYDNDIDIKLRPVTKLDKRNKIPSKQFDNDVMSENYDIIFIFPIYGRFGAIWKPNSVCIVYKKNIFVKSRHLDYKERKHN